MAEPVNVVVNFNRPPQFSGRDNEDCDVHWLKFIDDCEDCPIAEAQRITKFRVTLSSEARQWYEDNKDSFTTVAGLKAAFVAALSQQQSRPELIQQFQTLALRPSETLQAFKKRVKHIASKARIVDQEMITLQFVKGLPASIQGMVYARRDATLDEAFQTAQAVHSYLPAAAPQAMLAYQSAPAPLPCQPPAQVPIPSLSPYQPSPNTVPMNDMADQFQQLYVNRRVNASPARGRQWSPQNRGDRYRSGDFPRARRSPSDSRREFSEDRYRPNNRDDRRPSRSPSRGRDSMRRPPTPRRASGDRQVSFSDRPRSQSPSPIVCLFCQQKGHRYAQCYKLRQMLQNGSFHGDQNFH